MNIQDSAGTDSISTERRLAQWLEKNIGGNVTSMERQGRWRPAWFVDMEDLRGAVQTDRLAMGRMARWARSGWMMRSATACRSSRVTAW